MNPLSQEHPRASEPPPAALREQVVRGLCIAGGGVCLGLAVLGAVLPLLPTTPFLLLAAALFFRGSPRLYHWLLSNRQFGPLIRDYRAGRGIPRRAQRLAILLVWLSLGATVAFVNDLLWLEVLLLANAIGVTIYLARLPVRENWVAPIGDEG